MKVAAHDARLQPALDALKVAVFDIAEGGELILHRREIVRREGPFALLRDEGRRKSFDDGLLSLIEEQPFLVMTVVIDKKEHLERYKVWRFDPYHYCLQCLVERYVSWLERHDLTGDVVVEARFKKVDKKLKASFRSMWERGTGQMADTVAQRRLNSREIGLFRKHSNIAGLQLCDLIAHPSAREVRRLREDVPPYDDFGAKVAEILTRKKYARHPQSRRIDGWGTKWLP
jgi:hypothetical protein